VDGTVFVIATGGTGRDWHGGKSKDKVLI